MSRQPVRKKRRLTPPTETALHPDTPPASASDSDNGGDILADNFVHRAARWDLEQDYETRPRKQKDKENLRLPIKTADGLIKQVKTPAALDDAVSSSPDAVDNASDVESGSQRKDESEPQQPKLTPKEEVIQAKEELARIAGLINEDPETHVASLRSLAEITASENPTVTKLGLVTQLTVYKDIIPGYRIRAVSEDEMKIKLSKDVRKLRNFEQSIVTNYQHYVKELSRIASLGKHSSSFGNPSLSSVALSCATSLLTSVPHFNFRADLLRIAVDRLGSKSKSQDVTTAIEALQKLFAEDDEGNSSLEAVSILLKMIKAKNYHVQEEVVNLFLYLRLLSEFSQKASTTKVDAKKEDPRPTKERPANQKRGHRSKKEKKLARETKAIEKEMKEADAIVSHEQRDKNQAETLKQVFSVYFRILKARTPHLMGPVLEGLVKYAHLINQDFFADLIEALKELIEEKDAAASHAAAPTDYPNLDSNDAAPATHRNITRESLLCCITAFALLEGQDASAAASTLHLDLTFFITHLYRTLYSAATNADLELSAKSLHLPDPAAKGTPTPRTKVDVQTTIVLLLRSLQSVLLPPANPHAVSPLRLAAFTKQILTASLNMPEKSSTAVQNLVGQVVKTHRRKIGALWNTEERRSDGVFDPLRGTVEGCNPFACTVWEGELLRLHYAPGVREGWAGVEKAVAQ